MPACGSLIRPCRVQGEGAGHEVARAIRDVSRHPGVDVVIVARGGGSLEDLWAFNEEAVARAIAASPVPVVSGVGHEIDTTIADFVADVRAATPSNAAEIVVARRDELARRIAHLDHRARAAVRQRVAAGRAAVHALGTPPRAPDDPDPRLEPRAPASASCRRGSGGSWPAATSRRGSSSPSWPSASPPSISGAGWPACAPGWPRREDGWRRPRGRRHHRAALAFGSLAGRLDALSPLAVLGRGYAVCFAADGRTVLRDAASTRDGDTVHVRLEHGRLACTVTGREAEEATRPARPDRDG